MTRILADLPDEDIKWLDRQAAEQGKSRPALLRDVTDGELRMVRAEQLVQSGWADRFDDAMRKKKGGKLTFLIILLGLGVVGGIVMLSARSAAQANKAVSVSTASKNEAVAAYLETHMDSFGYKTSWIALKAESPTQVITALQLSDVKAMDWNEGVALGNDNQNVQAKRLFVSGVVDGWHFILGAIPDPIADLAKFEKLMSKLANVSDDVQYFISHRIGDGYGWTRYRNGKLTRRIIWYNGAPRFEFGKLDQAESQIVQSWKVFEDGGEPYTLGPDEDDVLKIAANWSVDPSSFDRLKSEVPVGLVGKQAD